MKQIKPCPFCGSENLSVGSFGNYIKCKNCGTAGPDGSTLNEAFDKWNAATRKEDAEMEKNCANCVHISKEIDGKVYCTQDLDADYSCKYWEKANHFEPEPILCGSCKYSYIYVDDELRLYCGREIGKPEGYVCDKWVAKESKSTPLNTSNSRGLYDGRNDCDYPNLSGGCRVFPAGKPFIDDAEEALDVIRTLETKVNEYQMAAEEAAELAQALLKYCRVCKHGSYTPMNPKDATDAVIEEYADLLLAMEASFPRCEGNKMFYNNLKRVYKEKAKRWAERLKERGEE